MTSDKVIELNDTDTWGDLLLNFFETNYMLFENYNNRSREIVSSAPAERFKASNQYETHYVSAVEQLSSLTKDMSLSCYHGTRLTYREIEHIREFGMELLSLQFSIDRIAALVSEGMIDPVIADKIQRNNSCDDENRSGMIWFVCGKENLKCEAGMGGLLGIWGGEAISDLFLEDNFLIKKLRAIGVPCLINAAITKSELQLSGFLEKNLIAVYLEYKKGTKSSIGIDVYSQKKIRPDQIRSISIKGDKEFEILTESQLWDEPL